MTEEVDIISVENVPEQYKKTLEWINSLKKPELVKELERRNLEIIGTVSELKIKLFWHFLPKDLAGTNNRINTDQSKESQKIINNFNMNKNLFFKPTTFSGGINERVDSFLKTFNRAATINNWSEIDKPQYLVAFLQGPALTFYDNIESKNLSWKELEVKFREEFEPIAQNDMLRILLERRKQVDDEPTGVFINEIEALCKRVDKNMSEEELVRNVMKGLKPGIARYIGILENRNLDELKKNIHKYEMVEFMITGETAKSPSEIKQSIITEKINQMAKFNDNDEIKKLNEEIFTLKQSFNEYINFIPRSNQYQDNSNLYNNLPLRNNQYQNNNRFNNNFSRYNGNRFQNNNMKPRDNFSANNNQFQNQYSPNRNNFYDNGRDNFNNHNRGNRSQFNNSNDNNYSAAKFNNRNSSQIRKQNYKPQWNQRENYQNVRNYQSNVNTQNHNSDTLKCNFCSKNSHASENCFLRDKIKCQLCDVIGHTALNCVKNSKNLNQG